MPKKEFKKLSNDYMFKLIFANKRFMNYLISKTLNRTLEDFMILNKADNQEITSEEIIELIKQELTSNNIHTKRKTVDLLVKTKNEIIDFEYNNIFDEETRTRNVAYITNIFSNALEQSKLYIDQPRCTQINLCSKISEDYDFDTNNIRGEKYNKKLIENINILVYNIENYKKILYTKNEEAIRKYAYLIMFDCDEEELELLGQYDEMVKEIGDMVKKYNDDSKIYSFLTDEESKRKLIESRIAGAVKREQEKTKIETAKSLLSENVSLDIISRTTGYSQEYLQTIKS